MELRNEFSVAVPVEQAWTALLDVERVAPCMPGATLTSFDGSAFTGTVRVKLGPVNLTYAGKGRFVSRDAFARQVVIEASGKDSRGSSTAAATITAVLASSSDTATTVTVVTDLRITGAPAQFGRGMIAGVAGKLVTQFADCLATTLAAADPPLVVAPAPSAPAPSADAPVYYTPEPTPASAAAPAAATEAIDLLAISGVSGRARRAAPYVLTFLVGAAIGAVIVILLT